MQCPTCEFHNTPGTNGCIRCGTRLDLGGIAIEPPRASSIAAVRSARLLGSRAGIAWRDATGDAAGRLRSALRIGRADWDLVAALVASVVPGLGQWRGGQRALGAAIFGVWLCMAFWAVLSMGTDWNWVAFMCMLGTHSTAVNLLLGPRLRTQPALARAGIGLLVYLSLLCGLYWPARIVSGQLLFTAPVDRFLSSSRVRPGDVLLCSGPWLHGREWRIGEIVMYGYTAGNGQHGVGVDRIIAGSGDVVTICEGKITVNEKAPLSFLAPLRDPDRRMNATIFCPEGSVIIFPSMLQWQTNLGEQAGAAMSRIVERACVVPREAIQARVLARVRPLTRMGLVD